MDAVLETARRLGWSEDRLHYEFFAASVEATGDAFEVKLASSGKTVAVPAEQTVAEALAAAGIEVPVSCGQGICGT
ncbi:2Fe-2S iron-sulfur cluster-binding protein, partial [Providencia rettgeri]|uniref:2Fe-2S iron-sulfur cluster-binding protein n=5 Tax=Pseudomonadota TaxID=1224 RepID=UPI00235F7435